MFVGREPELRLLSGIIAQVREGMGGAVWLEGPPGIGKSALIAAALDGAGRHGCRVYSGAASERSPLFPLAVVLDVLGAGVVFADQEESEPDAIRESRADIAGLLSGARRDVRTPVGTMVMVAERVVALVDRLCALSPVILVVDDAQWADQASIEILIRLTGMLRQLPLLLVAAARPVPAGAEATAFRQAVAAADGVTIELGPVSDSEAAEITRQLIGGPPGPVLARQLTLTAGNPLYLRELIDSLVRESRLRLDATAVELRGDPSDLPASLTVAIGLRLGFLSESAMSALRVAAVLGPSFSVADLSTVTCQRASELAAVVAEAVTAGILTDSQAGMAFRHELIYHTLYHGMPVSLRTALHRQAAEYLARAGARAEQVADQLLIAPPQADSWMIDWVAGAAPVLSQRAPRVSVDLLVRAREGLVPQDSRRELLDAELATANLLLGNNEEAVRLARSALTFTRDPALAGQVAWTLTYALPRLGRVAEAIEVADKALARAELPPVWAARLRACKGMSLLALGRYDEARFEAEQAEAAGNLAGDRLAIGYSLYTIAEVEINQRRNAVAGKVAYERALAMFAGDPEATDLVLLLMANLGGVLSGLGMPDAADGVFATVAAMLDRGTEPRQAQVRVLSAVYAFYRGRWDDALAEVETAERLPLEATYRQYLPGVVAQVAVHRDNRATADSSLRGAENVRLADYDYRLLIEFLLVAWALAAERDARPAEALARLVAIFDPDGTREFAQLGVISSQWLPDVVRLALSVGEPDIATAATRACTREADRQGRPTPKAAAQHCQGLLDRDADAVQATAALFRSIGYPLLSAQALENAGVLYAELGEIQAARSAYHQAIDIYCDLGAEWDIIRADARLRQYGIRRGTRAGRDRPTTGWDALTPIEQKIARLIAEGLSNPDIASRVFLSRNTVQTHVSHILKKLRAQSRVEIVRTVPHQLGRPLKHRAPGPRVFRVSCVGRLARRAARLRTPWRSPGPPSRRLRRPRAGG